MDSIRPSEITPEHIYLSRRQFMVSLGSLALSTLFLGGCEPPSSTLPPVNVPADELGSPVTSLRHITNYNNFYEFSLDKEGIGDLARNFKTSPWAVAVGGLVNRPRIYDLDELVRKFSPEERIYRLRCVEAWSMVIPWLGFPLSRLLEEAEPQSKAKFVRFEALFDPKQMPGQKLFDFGWPYIEGLRLDEAMHKLTLLAIGLYGKPLPPQDGAPIRLVVPWKYGFKSIKSIVKIDLVEKMPVSFWMTASPEEYGFYSNVNPDVPHPRWPQSSERRIGEFARRRTLLFNGYAEEVAYLYQGLDLKKNF
ncbi:MAG: protein-methionine-sulfoxide reductase catalytic subunit MsrP [Chloroflexi bacterium]|nr:protein-methionine-sulfoxide reductase catalytic subunit MsrP [Chloroflexota bacterium]